MENITVKDIVEAVDGRLLCGNPDQIITSISTNSREMDETTLFVPLIGERVNAHRFIQSALQSGGAALTQEHDAMEDRHCWIRVENTQSAMQALASYYRGLMKLPIVAVTGSVGKTTTRDMISTALSAKFRVFRTEGNLNSQVGVPITLARISSHDEVAVLEAGMSMKGEMTRLAAMIRPDMAVFTNIGVAHIENLKTQDGICLEKMELINTMPENGVVFLNGDDEILLRHRDRIRQHVLTYGLLEGCDYRGTDIRIENNSTYFSCTCHGKTFEVVLNVLGEHNVRNALAAIAVSDQLGIDPVLAAGQFMKFEGLRQRVYQTDTYTVIDDTYNASPDSMKASLDVLSQMECKGRRIAVLADMLELGEDTIRYHYEVGTYLADRPVDELYVVGELASHIQKGAIDRRKDIITQSFADNDTLIQFLAHSLKTGDCILLKGSNGMKLQEIAKTLLGKK